MTGRDALKTLCHWVSQLEADPRTPPPDLGSDVSFGPEHREQLVMVRDCVEEAAQRLRQEMETTRLELSSVPPRLLKVSTTRYGSFDSSS